jgi:thiamine pyrophosphate-dependent acetolactate synthase large subunit-like protein
LFDEMPYNVEEAEKAIRECDYLLIIGTSLQISYTTILLASVNRGAKVYYVDPDPQPYLEAYGIFPNYIKTTATQGVPVAIMDIILDEAVDAHIQKMRELTFHMSDEEARVVIDEYIDKDEKLLLAAHSREWYYVHC